MWNFESLTHHLGDAFEKVRKEVESLSAFEENAETNATTFASAGVVDDVFGGPFVYEEKQQEIAQPPVQPREESLLREEEQRSLEEAAVEVGSGLREVQEDGVKQSAVLVQLTVHEGGVEGAEMESAVSVELIDSSNAALVTDRPKRTTNKKEVECSSASDAQRLLAIREQQLQEQSFKLLQLQERNEALERSALSISQKDHDAMRYQYEERLGHVEARIYALTKENDSLRREAAQDSHKDATIKEKDEIIEEVMAEGQRLSKKQMDLENAIRKKAARIREIEEENEGLKEKLVGELSKCEQLSVEKRQLAQTLQDSETLQKEQLEIQRTQFEKLLEDANAAQARADQAAKEVAKEGLLKRAQEAEARNQTQASHLEALHEEMESQKRQSEAAELKRKHVMNALEQRCHEAETRHEELLVKFPEATKPLLRQLETLQADMDTKSEAWLMAERSLLEQLETAEDALQTAEAKEQAIQLKLKEVARKFNALEVTCQECREELETAVQSRDALQSELEEMQESMAQTQGELREQVSETERLKSSQHQVLEQLQKEISAERMAKLSAEMELRQLQVEHQKQKADFEDLMKTTHHNPKLHRSGSIVDEISVISEATDRDADVVSSRGVIHSRSHQLERLQKQIQSLEKTRDHLSAELVAVTQRATKAESNMADFEKAKKELSELQSRYSSAIELLGEREEHVEELKSDLEDFKQMYREQITYVAEQLCTPKP